MRGRNDLSAGYCTNREAQSSGHRWGFIGELESDQAKMEFMNQFIKRPQGDRRGALTLTCGQTDGNEWVFFFFFLPVLLFRLVELLRRT